MRRAALLLLLLLGALAATSCRSPGAAVPPVLPPAVPAPAGEPPAPTGPLIGPVPPEQVAPELSGPVAIMIDNSAEARPQSGLERADLVYEAPMEGWAVTRFMAIYYTHAAPQVGPIRSARTYFVDLARSMQLPYAHAGGNADALDQLARLGIKNFDEIYSGGGYFYRTHDRLPPYNLYSSTNLLLAGVHDRGYKPAPPPDLARGPAPPGGNPVTSLRLRNYGTPEKPVDVVSYTWQLNRWQRAINGEPHLTADGAVLAPPNLAVLVAPVRYKASPIGEEGLAVDLSQGGTAYFLRDGRMWTGTWRRPGPNAPPALLLDGRLFPWAEGPVWVHIIMAEDRVSASN